MSNPTLTKKDLEEITAQITKLEEGVLGDNINSLTVRFSNGTTGTLTRTIEKDWQITLSGRAEDGYR